MEGPPLMWFTGKDGPQWPSVMGSGACRWLWWLSLPLSCVSMDRNCQSPRPQCPKRWGLTWVRSHLLKLRSLSSSHSVTFACATSYTCVHTRVNTHTGSHANVYIYRDSGMHTHRVDCECVCERTCVCVQMHTWVIYLDNMD